MLEYIPVSVIYAFPVIVFFVLCTFFLRKISNILHASEEKKTAVIADTAAREILKSKNMSEIPIVRSDNFTQNEFDVENNQILLSPDTIGYKDLHSLSYALRTAGYAIFCHEKAGSIRFWKKLKTFETVLFWCVFTFLAFGIMSSHLTWTIVGYAVGVLMLIVHGIGISFEMKINQIVLDEVKRLQLLSETEEQELRKVLWAEAFKF